MVRLILFFLLIIIILIIIMPLYFLISFFPTPLNQIYFNLVDAIFNIMSNQSKNAS